MIMKPNAQSRHIMFLLVIFLAVCGLIQPEPCKLQIMKDGTEIPDQDLCLEEFNATECAPFVKSFDPSDLPDVFPQDGLSVEKPASLNVVGLEALYKDVMYSGLSIRWELPISDTAKRNLIGFLFDWHFEGDTLTRCRMFRFNNSSPLLTKKVSFQYDIPFVNPSSNYTVRLYSLPPPKYEYRDDPRTFARMLVKTSASYRPDLEPGHWTPTVSVSVGDGDIGVWFSLAPPAVNITQFDVLLMKKPDWQNPILTKNYLGEVYSMEKPQGFVLFENLHSGIYQVVIIPLDPFRGNPDKCLCWVTEDNGGKHCKNICSNIATQWFALNTSEETTIFTASTTMVTDSTTEGSDASKETKNMNHLYAIIGAVVGLVVLVAFVCYCWRGPSRAGKKTVLLWIKRWCPVSKSKPTEWESTHTTNPISGQVEPLKTKTVYILFSDDHEAHSFLVECFAKFLAVHGHCNVIHPPWCVIQQNGGYEWFLSVIYKADYIIFIESEGAEKLWTAHLENKIYPGRHVGPEGDLFGMGLKHILRSENARDIVVSVSFGAQNGHRCLPSAFMYQLPKHLSQFWQKIHDLSPRAADAHAGNLPMYAEILDRLPEGAALLGAIKKCRKYEEDNPQWLMHNFGDVKPRYEQSISSGSQDSGVVIKKSVSSQDVTSLSDTQGSPTSVFVTPTYPHFPGGKGWYQMLMQEDWETRPGLRPARRSWSDIFDLQSKPVVGLQAYSSQVAGVIPPGDTEYENWDNFSTAVRAINANPGSLCTASDVMSFFGPGGASSIVDIKSPDSPSEILVEDSVSNALRQINANSENMLTENEGHNILSPGISFENGDSGFSTDSVSV